MNLEEMKAKRKELKEAMRKDGKTALMDRFLRFFEDCPQAIAIRWRQYTPYFNDGDACHFGVQDIYVKYNLSGLSEEADDDHGEGFIGEYELDDKNPIQARLARLLRALNSDMQEAEDILEEVFDDHVEVTIKRDLDVEVDSYEHD